MQQRIHNFIDHSLGKHRSGSNSLETYFYRFQQQEQIARITDLDIAVYERMYPLSQTCEKKPTPTQVLKIRYWRCGYNLPATRSECIHLAYAIRLSLDELQEFLMYTLREPRLHLCDVSEWIHAVHLVNADYDWNAAQSRIHYCLQHLHPETHSETLSLKTRFQKFHTAESPIFDPPPLSISTEDILPWFQKHPEPFLSAYAESKWLLFSLAYRYLIQCSPERLSALRIKPGQQYGQLRHLLYSDVLDCLDIRTMEDYHLMHMYSRDFSSEINRYFKRGERLSRSSLLRLILIFTMPDINIDSINTLLLHFGYAPLSTAIHTPSGASPDTLLLDLLSFYETLRTGNWDTDRKLFQNLLKTTDQILNEKLKDISPARKGSHDYYQRLQLKDLRLMAFRSLRKDSI